MGSERRETVRSLSTGGVGCLTERKDKYERNILPWPLVYRLFETAEFKLSSEMHSRAAKPYADKS